MIHLECSSCSCFDVLNDLSRPSFSHWIYNLISIKLVSCLLREWIFVSFLVSFFERTNKSLCRRNNFSHILPSFGIITSETYRTTRKYIRIAPRSSSQHICIVSFHVYCIVVQIIYFIKWREQRSILILVQTAKESREWREVEKEKKTSFNFKFRFIASIKLKLKRRCFNSFCLRVLGYIASWCTSHVNFSSPYHLASANDKFSFTSNSRKL